MTAAPRLRPRPQRPPTARPAPPVRWRLVEVSPPPELEQLASIARELARAGLM
jgi:hypothetical protein